MRSRDLDQNTRELDRVIATGNWHSKPQIDPQPDSRYLVKGGHTYHRRKVQNELSEHKLANFDARIVSEVVVDDGFNVVTEYEITAGGRTGTVPASQFSSLSWVPELLGARGIIEPGQSNRDHLRAAILELSQKDGPVPRRTVYTVLGWRKVRGTWHYLHGGGAIGSDGPVSDIEVAPAGDADRFVLHDPATGDALVESVAALVRLTETADKHVAYPMLAALVRSVISAAPFTMWIVGPTGAFKTAYSALFQQAFGPTLTGERPPIGWESTANAIENLLHVVGDALLVIDDFAPQSVHADLRDLQRKASRLVRAQGNLSARNRLNKRAQAMHARPPRGLAVVTAEDLPEGHSLLARTCVVEISHGDVMVKELTVAQEEAAAGVYSEAIAAYIQHLAGSLDEVRADHRTKMIKKRQEYLAKHRRTAAQLAELDVALERFLQWAEAIGAIGEREAAAHMHVARGTFETITERMATALAAEDYVTQFVRRLAVAISSGKAHVADGDSGGEPASSIRWGWRNEYPLGVQVGWIRKDTLYLNLGPAMKAVEQAVGPISVTANTLARRMDERGLLVEKDQGRLTTRATLARSRHRVHAIAAQQVMPCATAEDAAAQPDPDEENPPF